MKAYATLAFTALLFILHSPLAFAQNMDMATSFLQNKGQIVDQYDKPRLDITYKLQAGGGLNIFVGSGQLHYQWSKSVGSRQLAVGSSHSLQSAVDSRQSANRRKTPVVPGQIETYRMDVALVGANAQASVIEDEPQAYTENYYLAQCPNGVQAHSYGKITFKDIYPHIDWVLYPKDGGLEYDFIVHPGGNAGDIQLQYNGSTALNIKEGALTATTPMGHITEQAPYCYAANTKEKIQAVYRLEGNMLSFYIQQAEGITGDIVIDPALRWASYFGGTANEQGNSVATDTAGNVYIAGETSSTNNIATTGAFQTSFSGGVLDMILAKFNRDGAKKWGTYYGGNKLDYGYAVATDKIGHVYLGGWTDSSAGLASTGAFQATVNLGGSGVLMQLDSLGNRQWSTYYGDSFGSDVNQIFCDNANNVLFAGACGGSSPGHLATPGAFQDSGWGYIAKFTSGGSRIWGTCFDAGFGSVTCDAAGNVIAAGEATFSSSYRNISTPGAYRTTAIADDYCLVKFNSSGTTKLWCTYYPTGYGIGPIACDAANNIYFGGGGITSSNITTTGAYQTSAGSGQDGIFSKFSPTGQVIWTSYYGGNGDDGITGLTLDANGDVIIAGTTESTNNMASAGAYKITKTGTTDFFWAQFSPDSKTRKYATYYGGGSEFAGYIQNQSIAYNSKYNKIYFGGCTNSTSGIAYGGVGQTNSGGIRDAFVVQFDADTSVYIKQPFTDTALCVGDTLVVPYGITQHFRSGNTFILQMSNSSGSFASPTVLATVTADTAGVFGCRVPSVTLANGYRLRIVATMPIDTSNADEYPIHIGGIKAANPSASSNAPVCYNGTLNLSASSTTSGVSYTWTGPDNFYDLTQNPSRSGMTELDTGMYIVQINYAGCAVKDTINVSFKPTPAKPTAGSNSPVCPGTTLNLTGSTTTGGVSYSWTGPNGFTASTQNPSKTNVVFADSGRYVLTVDLNGCTAKDTTHVITQILTPTPSASSNSPICAGSTISLSATAVTGATYNWTGPTGFTATGQTTTRPFAGTNDAGIYSVTANVGGCVSLPGTVNVVINQGPLVNIFPHPSINICSGDSLTLVAIPTNGGPNPTFQWYKNNVLQTGQTGVYYTTLTAADKDSFYVMMTVPASVCNSSIGSNMLKASVTPATPAPVSTIVDNPSTNIWPGLNVQFSISSMANQGSSPAYQWMRNSKPVIGAINNTWGATTLNNEDTVCLLLTSSNVCARPKSALSNCIVVKINTGIDKVKSDELNIYPNPNHGNFTIESKETGTLYLYSVTGQLVASYTVNKGKTNINLNTSLSTGNYTGRFVTAEKTYELKIVLE